ncbi:hypothetical protein BDN72DRAFT_848564 [Pluteus cervinus]|uniref:Uncharacterized protein n=1 Tax=Pluteus cervinus TaxID=181527 RepID=A0ACD3ACG4_9AGAR|nr:hypothetical protein BDN72DRAFT_848564 [Pluteus cervinus]
MITWIPISSPIIRFADHFVDAALGFSSGIVFFLCHALFIRFEVVAFNLVLNFWTNKIPVAVVACYAYVLSKTSRLSIEESP